MVIELALIPHLIKVTKIVSLPAGDSCVCFDKYFPPIRDFMEEEIIATLVAAPLALLDHGAQSPGRV